MASRVAQATVSTVRPIKPIRLQGKVVQGFKRGSRLLGTPTANLDPKCFSDVIHEQDVGVYVGWARVEGGVVYKSVLSIGYNPYFKNKLKTVEAYLLHEFEEDFYGADLQLLICGWMRPMLDFDSLDALKEAIANDVHVGSAVLDQPRFQKFQTDSLFQHSKPSKS